MIFSSLSEQRETLNILVNSYIRKRRLKQEYGHYTQPQTVVAVDQDSVLKCALKTYEEQFLKHIYTVVYVVYHVLKM